MRHGKSGAEGPGQLTFLVGRQEMTNGRPIAVRYQKQPADQLPLPVFLQVQAHPAAYKCLPARRGAFRQMLENQLMLGDANPFGPARVSEIGPESPPHEQNVEPGKARDGPSTDHEEHRADGQIDHGDKAHDQDNTLAAQAAVRRQDDLPGFRVALLHGPILLKQGYLNRNSMAKVTRLQVDAIAEVFRRFQADNPEPKGELHSKNVFTLLVAVVLSAQATDEGVNRATGALFKIADTPAMMVALGEDRLREYIKTIGLFRAKARNVIALSQLLIDRHGGEVPDTREALEALPGVGRKTANVILNVAFGHPTIAVDTHLFRLGNRTGLAPGKSPRDVEMKLLKAVPESYRRHAHHWLILHGRYVCKARKPECWRCLISDLCLFQPKTPAPI